MSVANTERLELLLDNLDEALDSGLSIEQLTEVARKIIATWKEEESAASATKSNKQPVAKSGHYTECSAEKSQSHAPDSGVKSDAHGLGLKSKRKIDKPNC